MSNQATAKIRRDGWTAQRQLRFLDTLARTRSVTRAAKATGMSRESAYRFRARRGGALFAVAWNRVLEGHKFAAAAPRAARIFRGNRAKVTKSTKWKEPGFQSLLDRHREL